MTKNNDKVKNANNDKTNNQNNDKTKKISLDINNLSNNKTEKNSPNSTPNQIAPDTIKLLRECDSGIKMGVSSIAEVLDYVKNEQLKTLLNECKETHEKIRSQLEIKLEKCHDQGKNPNPFAKGMSWIKTNTMLVVNESDETIADLMTEGCNMGVKSLSKYLNQYCNADEDTKDLTRQLIDVESKTAIALRQFL